MSKEKEGMNIGMAIQLLQVLVLAAGLAGVFVKLGKSQAAQEHNSMELTELKDIVQELARTQVEFASTSAVHAERIDALRIRVDRLEP